ncbi:MAG: S-layer homology domain-containing protein [Syntrophomonadaceae bacterium]|nr:S-layer homology domain-containing protein [Syntrophomonadaceae bacterium]
MQALKKKWSNKLFITILGWLLIAASFNLTVPASALAAPSDSFEISGDGVNNSITFTRAELEGMQQYQHVYSAINTWPSKKWYVGKGIKLKELIASAGMKKDARQVKFSSNDGYSITLTVKELFEDNRYYFPHFQDTSGNNGDGTIAGSTAGAEAVEPIIALLSVEGSNNPDYMNDLNSLLLMLGQRAVTEQTGNLFVKNLKKIEVLTTEPDKWDSPQANPGSGEVPPGCMVALSNAHMDDDKVYYTTDGSIPTVNSSMYNWISKRWWSSRADVLGVYNHPIGPINNNTTIKAITIGPGKMDSDVVTFSYQVADAAASKTDPAIITPAKDPEKSGQLVKLTDITGHWAQKNIEKLVGYGAVAGQPDGAFNPDLTITRAEFATMLVKAFKLENRGGNIFADTATHWAKDYIAAAATNGVVNGYDASTFFPNNPVTREQMAVMITKAARLDLSSEEPGFADSASISGWAREAVTTVNKNGIMKGFPGNTIRPQGNATRAEAVTVIVNALDAAR